MATATKTYTFTAGTSASAAEVNKNFDDILLFFNGGAVQHSDGSKPYTGYPLLPVAAPTNDRHPAPKSYVDTKLTTRLATNYVVPVGAITTLGTTQGTAYNFPTKSLVVSAADVAAGTPFISQGELLYQLSTGPVPNTYPVIIETTVDGVVSGTSWIFVTEGSFQTLGWAHQFIPTVAGTKTVRFRVWNASGSVRVHTTAKDTWWGVWRTAA